MSDSQPASANRAVFLSYASQDAEAAKRICDALRAAGVEVWFDQSELVGGDVWDTKIKRQIQSCALFVPVVSANTQQREEGYFRREWNLAANRTLDMAHDKAFLLPVIIDTTSDSAVKVPEKFREVQWTRLARGETTPAFVARVKNLLDGSVVGPAGDRVPGQQPGLQVPPARKSGMLPWAAIALSIVVLGLVAYIALRPTAKETSSAPAPARPVADTKPAVPAPTPLVTDKSIAVLPFVNRSTEKENEFFTDGLHDDIVVNLSQIAELRVASNSSVARYRSTTKTPKEIGAELHVAYLLTASVQRSGNRVHLVGELMNIRTETTLPKTVDRELKDIFALQAELANAIAADLHAAISPDERSLLMGHPTENLAAYDLYLKGFNYSVDLSLNESERWARYEPLLRKAVELDPNFLRAWGTLLGAYSYRIGTGSPKSELLSKAREAYDAVMRIAPDSNIAMLQGARYYLWCLEDIDRALASTNRFIKLQPNNPEGYFTLEVIQFRQGKLVEAIANLRKYLALEPTDWFSHSYLFGPLEGCRRYEELIPEIQGYLAHHPESKGDWPRLVFTIFRARGSAREGNDYFASLPPDVANSPEVLAQRKTWADMRGELDEYLRLGALLPESPSVTRALDLAVVVIAKGDAATARAKLAPHENEAMQATEKNPTNHGRWRTAAQIAAILGHADEARRCLAALEKLPAHNVNASRTAADNLRTRAFVDTFLGDKDRAIEEYGKLFGMVFSGLSVPELRHHPNYAPLRGDPKFEALLDDPKNNAPLL